MTGGPDNSRSLPPPHRFPDDELAHARSWLAAVRDGAEAAAALEAIYRDTAAEIERRGPACWASGRCCNFAKTGHLLYVTGLEAAYCVARLEPRHRGEAGGSDEAALGSAASGLVSLPQIQAARGRGDCPFLDGNLCGAHAIKPLGCRVYFCDQTAQGWQQDLSEHMLGKIRAVHEAHALAYRYGEWRGMLELISVLG